MAYGKSLVWSWTLTRAALSYVQSTLNSLQMNSHGMKAAKQHCPLIDTKIIIRSEPIER